MRLLKNPKWKAPALQSADWAGNPVLPEVLLGRVVLLEFFSLGDPEVTRGLTWAHALGDTYCGAGLTIVGVHVPAYEFERSHEAARREIWRLGIPHSVALDHDFSLFHAYHNHDLPARFLLDHEGTVRGWHHGEGGFSELEHGVRVLLREAHPEDSLPGLLDPPEGIRRPGRPCWMPSPEIRFGARGVGFGMERPSGEANGDTAGGADSGATKPDAAGAEREFEAPPELRAEGKPYLEGRWALTEDAIRPRDEGAAISVVFEGASLALVLSIADREQTGDAEARVGILLDGNAVPEDWGGSDLTTEDGETFLRVARGGVYRVLDAMPFDLHHLELRPTPGLSVHLISFGTAEVPPESA